MAVSVQITKFARLLQCITPHLDKLILVLVVLTMDSLATVVQPWIAGNLASAALEGGEDEGRQGFARCIFLNATREFRIRYHQVPVQLTSALKYSIVGFKPSASVTSGPHPSSALACVMSGCL